MNNPATIPITIAAVPPITVDAGQQVCEYALSSPGFKELLSQQRGASTKRLVFSMVENHQKATRIAGRIRM